MVDIPEHLLLRTAEARAKSLGITVEQALAELKGESPPTKIEKEPDVIDVSPVEVEAQETPPPPAVEVKQTPPPPAAEVKQTPPPPAVEVKETPPSAPVKEISSPAAAVKEAPVPTKTNGKTNGQIPPEVDFAPETKVTQRLLTVVKAKPIQKPTSEPVDKVNTWPHLMLPEFISLMAMTAFLIFISAILQAPLLEEANPNITPNPAKAPWYFLGLQELLSYWDPQIAGVMIPLIIGVVAFMAIPYIDRNKENKPSKRKYAIMLWTFFLAGAGTLSLIGILFRGPGWNWTYPWIDGVWFDDLLDWVHFE